MTDGDGDPFVRDYAVVSHSTPDAEIASGMLRGAIDRSGAQAVPCVLAELRLSESGPAAARRPGEEKYGYIDVTGAWVVEPKYDTAEAFVGGMAVVGVDSGVERRGFSDEAFCSEPVIEGGFAAVSVKTEGVGEDISDPFQADDSEDSGLAVSRMLWGVIDEAGEICIPLEYEDLTISEGIALAREGEDYLFLNLDGTPLNGERYFRTGAFHGGHAAVAVVVETDADASFSDGALWGIIDRTGAQVLPCEYEYLALGDGGTAVMRSDEPAPEGGINARYSYIDMDGEPLFDAVYDAAQPFYGDYAVVGRKLKLAEGGDSAFDDEGLGVIDRAGREPLPLEYSQIYVYEGDLYRARQGDEVRWFRLADGEAEEIEAPY